MNRKTKKTISKKDNSILHSIILTVIVVLLVCFGINWLNGKTIDLNNATEKLRVDCANLKQRNFNLQIQVERYTSWEYISTFIVKNKLPLKSANAGQVFVLSGEVFAIKGSGKKDSVAYNKYE